MSALDPFRLPMLWRTLRTLFAPPATRPYPFEVRPRPEGARGRLQLDVPSCVLCGICERRCPCGAISVSREEGRFTLEPLRCISCGACVEGCNKHSLRLDPLALPVQVQAAVTEQYHPAVQRRPACPTAAST